MSVSRPHQGGVSASSDADLEEVGPGARRRARRRAHSRSGEWREDKRYEGKQSLRVTMKAAHGLTPRSRLRVPMRFQCPPTGEFSRDWQMEWAKFTTLRVGERSRVQGKPLKQWQVSTLLMDEDAAARSRGLVVWHGNTDPQRLLRELALILGDDDLDEAAEPVPFRLTVTHPDVWGKHDFLVNSIAVLSGIRATQRPGEVGVEYVDLTFDEFDPLEIERRRKGDKPDKPDRVEIKSGDTLYTIAMRAYRDPQLYRLVVKANGIKGVSPGDKHELAKWARKHHRQRLEIPARD